MKIAIVVDSSCGLTEKQAKARGWFYLPIQIDIDNNIFKDGVDLDASEVFKHVKPNSKVLTSATLLGTAINLIKSIEKDYDKIIIYPISQKLSSQYQMLKMAFIDNDKVYVIPSIKISLPIVMELANFEALMKKRDTKYEEALKVFGRSDNSILLIPENGEALVRGGRLTPAAASVAKLLKIVPIIEFKDGELIKYGKGRIFEKVLLKLAKETYNRDSKKKFILVNADNENIENIAHNIINSLELNYIYVADMPPTISIHTGHKAIAIMYTEMNPTDYEALKDYMVKIEKIKQEK